MVVPTVVIHFNLTPHILSSGGKTTANISYN